MTGHIVYALHCLPWVPATNGKLCKDLPMEQSTSVSSMLAKAAADLIKALQPKKVGMVNGQQELDQVFIAHKKF